MVHLLRCGSAVLVAEDGEIGAVHSAQIAAAALFGRHRVRWVIALGIEIGGERQNFGRTELDAETAGLAALVDDFDRSFCHRNPHRTRDTDSLNQSLQSLIVEC